MRKRDVDHQPANANSETLPDTPGNRSGASKYVRHLAAAASSTATGEIELVCRVDSPGKSNFIRTPKDESLYPILPLLIDESTGKKIRYLLDPDLRGLDEVQDQFSNKMLAPYVNTFGNCGVWPISVENDDNMYVQSALLAVERAKREWIAVVPVRQGGFYRMRPCLIDHGEPKFPMSTVDEWIDLAFPATRQINSPDHPVLKRLREGR